MYGIPDPAFSPPKVRNRRRSSNRCPRHRFRRSLKESYRTFGPYKNENFHFSSADIEPHTDGKRSGSGFQRCIMRAQQSSFRPVLAPHTVRRSLQNPVAEREIRVVLISINCKTTIYLQSNKYEFITGEVRLSVQAPGGPEHRGFGTGDAPVNASEHF